MSLEVAYRDDGVTVGTTGPMFVSVFRQPTSLERVEVIRSAIEKHVAKHGDKNVSLTVVLPGAATLVSSEVREKTAALARDYPSIAAAIVLEGEGFSAALLRAALGAIFLIARTPYPHKIFGTIDEGVAWLRAMARDRAALDVPIDAALAVAGARA